MRREGWKHLAIEGWVFALIAVVAFVGGILVGDLGGSTKTETVYVSASSSESEGEGSEGEGAETSGNASAEGKQLFVSVGCGSCHTVAAAGTTGEVGPDLEKTLATDDNTAGIEEMIIHPNAEVIEGYSAGVMPEHYGQDLSQEEVHALAAFLVASTPAKP